MNDRLRFEYTFAPIPGIPDGWCPCDGVTWTLPTITVLTYPTGNPNDYTATGLHWLGSSWGTCQPTHELLDLVDVFTGSAPTDVRTERHRRCLDWANGFSEEQWRYRWRLEVAARTATNDTEYRRTVADLPADQVPVAVRLQLGGFAGGPAELVDVVTKLTA